MTDLETRCPSCGGDPELCTLGPTGCSPRYEYDPETGEVLKRPAMELLDPSPLIPDNWPTSEERDSFAIWEAVTTLERLNPNLLSPAADRWLEAYNTGRIR